MVKTVLRSTLLIVKMKELLEKLRESLGENFFDLTKPYVEQDGLKAAAEQVEQIIAPSSEVTSVRLNRVVFG